VLDEVRRAAEGGREKTGDICSPSHKIQEERKRTYFEYLF
jgi:hypothetical protein